MDRLKVILQDLMEIRHQLGLTKLDDNTLSDIASRIYISDKIGNKQAKSQNITPQSQETPTISSVKKNSNPITDKQKRLILKAISQGALDMKEEDVSKLSKQEAFYTIQELMGK